MRMLTMLSFLLLFTAGCDNLKSAKKDEPSSEKNEGKKDPKEPEDEGSIWTDEQKEEVMDDCIGSVKKSKGGRFDRKEAKEICNCRTDIIIKTFTYDEFVNFEQITGKKRKALEKKFNKVKAQYLECDPDEAEKAEDDDVVEE